MLLSSFLASVMLAIPAPDTLRTATIVAGRGIAVSRTDTLSLDAASGFTESLNALPGALVTDCGGAAGLKTVSLRGLGSAHTAIFVDGLRVSNIQSGQPDLGMFPMSGFGSLVVDYARNSLCFVTPRPVFADGSRFSGRAALSAGSFGTWRSDLRMDTRLSERICASVYASGLDSRGDFPVAGGGRRTNNDISSASAALDLFGDAGRAEWHAKVFAAGSGRGTPGSVDWPSGDRQTDRNAFAQAVVRMPFSQRYSMDVSAKVSADRVGYFSGWGDSRYDQRGLQFNTAHVFFPSSRWSFSLSADLGWDAVESTSYASSRLSADCVAAGSLNLGRLALKAALEFVGASDGDGSPRTFLAPSADLRFDVREGLALSAFVRRACRIPTFNELYYPGYGNPDLRTEDALLTDAGLDWSSPTDGGWRLSASADLFYNLVTDRIISVQSAADPALWLPCNVGRVRSLGTDLRSGISGAAGEWDLSASLRYSFQSALDMTPDSPSRGLQLPFVPKHSTGAEVSAGRAGWTLDTVWTMRAGRRGSYADLPGWNTLDMALSKSFTLASGRSLSLRVDLRNLFDMAYDLSEGYPMPGRSLTSGIKYTF